jgi:hypothetical protein
MAALENTMSNFGPERKRLIDGLKFILPTVLLVAIGFAFLRRANQTLLPVVLDFASATAIGITSGFATRWSLGSRSELLRSIVAVAMAVSALIVLGMITWGAAGIKVLYIHEDIDWNGLGQVIVAGSSALIALRAWSWRDRVLIPPPDSLPEPIIQHDQLSNGSAQPGLPIPVSGRTNHRRRVRSRASIISNVSRPFIVPRWRVPHWKLPRWKLPPLRMPRVSVPNINLRGLFGIPESQVKFTGAAEQRCPYCLDAIIKNDPRGVHACPICHTPHHADCWAMTGVCQIPHFHG